MAWIASGAGCQGSDPNPGVRPASGAQPSIPGMSGLALLDDSTYLVIHDGHGPAEPRAAILELQSAAAPAYLALEIRDERLPGGPLNDLESIAAIPGRASEFLLLESGASGEGGGGRRILAHVRLTNGAPRELRLLAWQDVRPQTDRLSNCEAIICWPGDGQTRLAIADRGRGKGDVLRAELCAGVVSFSGGAGDAGATLNFEPFPPDSPSIPAAIEVGVGGTGTWRGCSDLFLDARQALWGVCTQDLGDRGPFRSRIYRVGSMSPEGRLTTFPAQTVYEVDGFKLEALAACTLPHAGLCAGSDDEVYGGAWRPFADPPALSVPIPGKTP